MLGLWVIRERSVSVGVRYSLETMVKRARAQLWCRCAGDGGKIKRVIIGLRVTRARADI